MSVKYTSPMDGTMGPKFKEFGVQLGGVPRALSDDRFLQLGVEKRLWGSGALRAQK